MSPDEMIGQTFGMLTVLGRGEMVKFGRGRALYMRCRCMCGEIVSRQKSNLLSTAFSSCGCHRRSRIGAGAEARDPLYSIWSAMIERCYSVNNKSFADYGARGIRVCDRWLKGIGSRGGLECFIADMGERPHGLTLERKDNEKSYEPDNCEWASRKRQGRNKRNNRIVSYNGRSQSVSAWAEECGVPYFTLIQRLNRGWTLARAIATAVR